MQGVQIRKILQAALIKIQKETEACGTAADSYLMDDFCNQCKAWQAMPAAQSSKWIPLTAEG